MKVQIENLKDGMILESDVFTKNGAFILLSEGMTLNRLLINRLRDAGIREVDILVEKKVETIKKPKIQIEVKKFGQPEIKNEIDQNFNKISTSIQKIIDNPDLGGDKVLSFSKKLLDFIDNSFTGHPLYILETIASNKNIEDVLVTHMTNVAILSHMIAKWLDYKKYQLDRVTLAALFHDIGMLKINDVLLNKNDELSYYEFRDIKKHCRHARDLLNEWNFEKEVVEGVFHHHERIDASGYPLHLEGHEINEISKIIAVADVFDALTSQKPHRDAFSILDALKEMEKEALNKLDTRITKLFITKFFQNYLGQGVELTNNMKGKIIRLNSNMITRPLIACTDGTIFDLAVEKEISIKNFL